MSQARQLIGAIRYDLEQAESTLRNYPAEAEDYLRSIRVRLRALEAAIQEEQPTSQKKTA